MPPNPIAPASRVSQTCGLANALSSRRPVAAESPGHRGDERHHQGDGDQRETGDGPVGRAPAEALAQPGGGGDADHVGDRQAEHHQRNGPALAAGGRHARGDEGGDAEERTVRQAVEEAGRHQQLEVPGQRARGVEHGVRRHQRDQESPPRPLRAEEGDERSAHDHAHGVRRDDVAAGRDGDVDALRDLREQSHRDELGGADREPAHGKRKHRQREVPGAGGPGLGFYGRGHRHAMLQRGAPRGLFLDRHL